MGLFRRKSTNSLTLSDFKEERTKQQVSSNISPELLALLQKDGYGQNAKPGKSTTTINTSTYTAKQNIWEETVEINFSGDEVLDKTSFVAMINKKIEWLSENKKQIDQRIIEDLLELKNSTWLENNEKTYREDEFISKIKLTRITFSADNSFALYYDDGQMFGGHEITVEMNSRMELRNATI